MRFLLFVEGHTEQKALGSFLKRWLDPRLSLPVGITVIRFQGCDQYLGDIHQRAHTSLTGDKSNDIIAVIGLLDLYGLNFPDKLNSVTERYNWVKENIQKNVNHPKFRQFFLVHELEGLLFSDKNIFPDAISRVFPKKALRPETINFDEPPAKLLGKLYKEHINKDYRKTTTGKALFDKLNPEKAYEKCPYFKLMLDEMLHLAKDAGL